MHDENEVNRGSLVCVAVCGVFYSACVCVCVCVLGAAPRQHLWLSGVRVSSGRGRRSPLARYDEKREGRFPMGADCGFFPL